ncbi:MAG: DUF3604 domain-containing protein [bacterium]|nr:DUF3604 domain-containing protein [bacterium]
MKRTAVAICLAALVVGAARTGITAEAAQPAERGEWKIHRFCIRWGLRSTTRQVWDGHAELDAGEVIDVTPFIRHEIPYDSMRASANAWRSTTYIDAEGAYVTVRAPDDATVSIYTATHNFAFAVGALKPGETTQELDGEIEIQNVTNQALFRIAGLERGGYGRGTATISPSVARANTVGTWTITYTAAEGGLPVGGGIRVSWHFTRTWGEPQFADPKAKNYSSVSTTGECRLDYTSEHRGLLEYPFTQGRILVRVLDAPLREGEQIRVVLGDTGQGSPGFQAPLIAEQAAGLRVEDCTEVADGGFPVYRRLENLPQVAVHPLADPHRLFAVAPTIVQVGSPFDLKVVVEDAFRNVVTSFEGQLNVLIGGRLLREAVMTPKDSGTLTIPGLVLEAPGAYWVTIKSERGDVSGESNPIKCVAHSPQRRIVWGELHGHTEYSDGYGNADDYLRFARQRALLDFAAITDHDVELDAPDFDVVDMWKAVNTAVRSHHDPPHFCAILAYEWSPARVTLSTIAPYGDHNIFYADGAAPLFGAESPDSHTLTKLYRCLEAAEVPRARVIPHVGGAVGNWDYHNPALESVAEIYSVHGSFEAFGELALQRGYTVGFVAASDSHCGQIGGFPPGNAAGHLAHGGLTAAYTPENSRTALLDALEERSVYATSGPRVFVDFRINGKPMGTLLEASQAPEIEAEVLGTAPLLLIEVVKNGSVIHTWESRCDGPRELTLLWSNRVEQADLSNFDESLWSHHLRHVDWRGGASADHGRVSLRNVCSFDFPKDRADENGAGEVRWHSQTRGDWDGVVLDLPANDPKLNLTLGEYERTIDVGQMKPGIRRHTLGPSDRLIIAKGKPRERRVAIRTKDHTILRRRNYYYLRVLQADGETAWSSPVWVSSRAE